MSQAQRPIGRQRWVFAILFLALLLVRGWLVVASRFNSDEPQHAHVAWLIAHGHPHYSDVIDNHAPLFYSLWAPLIWHLPARPVTLTILRVTMTLPWLVQAASVYVLARSIAPRSTAVLLMLTAATLPNVLAVSVEFRPDAVWAALWLASIALLATGRPQTWRFALAGLLVGAAFGVSLKTTPLIIALGVTTIICAIAMRGRRRRGAAQPALAAAVPAGFSADQPWRIAGQESPSQELQAGCFARANRRIGVRPIAVFLVSILLVPAGIALWQWHAGSLATMIDQTLTQNVRLGDRLARDVIVSHGLWLVLTIAIGWAAYRWMPRSRIGQRRVWLAVLGLSTFLAFRVLWPVWERQDELPVMPLFVLAIGAIVLPLQRKLPAKFQLPLRQPSLAWAGVILVLLGVSLFVGIRHVREHDATFAAIEEASRIISPSDRVIDAKGDFVFYRRALPLVYEKLTRHRLNHRPMYDDGPKWLERYPTAVSVARYASFPPHTRDWLRSRYVVVGHIAVAGQRFDPADGLTRNFALPITGRYAWRGQSVLPPAKIDGQPVSGSIELTAGPHTLTFDAPLASSAAIVWQPAIDAGLGVDWTRAVRR